MTRDMNKVLLPWHYSEIDEWILLPFSDPNGVEIANVWSWNDLWQCIVYNSIDPIHDDSGVALQEYDIQSLEIAKKMVEDKLHELGFIIMSDKAALLL